MLHRRLSQRTSPAPAVSYVAPTHAGYVAPAPIVEYTSPAQAVSYRTPVLVQYAMPVQFVGPTLTDEISLNEMAWPTVQAAPTPVIEYIFPAQAVSQAGLRNPRHFLPEQHECNVFLRYTPCHLRHGHVPMCLGLIANERSASASSAMKIKVVDAVMSFQRSADQQVPRHFFSEQHCTRRRQPQKMKRRISNVVSSMARPRAQRFSSARHKECPGGRFTSGNSSS